MNSIEIAKKLIEENDKNIEDLRSAKTIILKRIEEYVRDIETHGKSPEDMKSTLAMAEEVLQRKQDMIEEYLVDNLALKMFVELGDELDILD